MIKWRNIDRNLFSVTTKAAFDLSGSASSEYLYFSNHKDIEIQKVDIIYTEASSSDTGVAINIGDLDSATTYGTFTSDVDKSAGDVVEYISEDLTDATVVKGNPLLVAHAGGKTGTGEVLVSITYKVIN